MHVARNQQVAPSLLRRRFRCLNRRHHQAFTPSLRFVELLANDEPQGNSEVILEQSNNFFSSTRSIFSPSIFLSCLPVLLTTAEFVRPGRIME